MNSVQAKNEQRSPQLETAAAANVQKLMGQHASHKQTLHYNRATLEKSRVISLRRIANRQAIKGEV